MIAMTEETSLITPEIHRLAEQIARERREKSRSLTSQELLTLTTPRLRDTLISAHEAAFIMSAITGRTIKEDYVKHLRQDGRLASAKQVSARVFIYRLRDLFFLDYLPVGRPKKLQK